MIDRDKKSENKLNFEIIVRNREYKLKSEKGPMRRIDELGVWRKYYWQRIQEWIHVFEWWIVWHFGHKTLTKNNFTIPESLLLLWIVSSKQAYVQNFIKTWSVPNEEHIKSDQNNSLDSRHQHHALPSIRQSLWFRLPQHRRWQQHDCRHHS